MSTSRTQIIVLALSAQLLAVKAQSQRILDTPDDSSFSDVLAVKGVSAVASLKNENLETSSRGGHRIEVYLNDGRMLYGDLLSVSDTTLTMYFYSDFSYSLPPQIGSGTYAIDLSEINRVLVKGRSNMLEGIFIGFLGGMLTGSAVSRIAEPRRPTNNLLGPGGLGGVGLLAGGAIGYLSSGRDLEFTRFEASDLNILNALCKFPKKVLP